MIARKHLLVGFCGLLVATALSLRTREGLREHRLALAAPEERASCPPTGGWASRPSGGGRDEQPALAAPRDYVLDPEVVPDEASAGPARIISLAPSITETLCALGLADRLVGRTQFCQYPPQIAHVRVVGSIMDTNLEMIRALEPDLVLTTSNSGDVGRKLRALGVRHESVPHNSLGEVFTAIERVGGLCGRPRTAARLVAAIRADLERLERAAPSMRARPLRVLMVCGELPLPPAAVWVAGPGLFLDTLLRASGHQNAAADVLKAPYGEIPLERLVVLDPEVMLTFPAEMPGENEIVQTYRSWTPLNGLQAIRQQRVRPFGGPEWLSAGPRVAVELHRLMAVLSECQ